MPLSPATSALISARRADGDEAGLTEYEALVARLALKRGILDGLPPAPRGEGGEPEEEAPLPAAVSAVENEESDDVGVAYLGIKQAVDAS